MGRLAVELAKAGQVGEEKKFLNATFGLDPDLRRGVLYHLKC